ncbi:hypothetical protein DM01DRAFT_1383117 [Hesseltinella vesiculosa]|uniref:Uncharacterized protein n=1 Tax=Hesseltinella vesiculosa TaxID=101127 RepID=A0A1X2GJK2_9FUNG|nr:hypothetical protein DM01DRAFT_1383117 [Hesseltinella vesiculosa]
MNSMGEVELQSTYYDPMLSALISDPSRDVILRRASKVELLSEFQPDTIVSAMQGLCNDLVRLTTLSKNTVDENGLKGCLSFQINGHIISYFMTQAHPSSLFTMVEFATMNFPKSLSDIQAFATLKNLTTLAKINSTFWSMCVKNEAQPTTSTKRVAINELYQVMNLWVFYATLN